jgi:hypothetical protein
MNARSSIFTQISAAAKKNVRKARFPQATRGAAVLLPGAFPGKVDTGFPQEMRQTQRA